MRSIGVFLTTFNLKAIAFAMPIDTYGCYLLYLVTLIINLGIEYVAQDYNMSAYQ